MALFEGTNLGIMRTPAESMIQGMIAARGTAQNYGQGFQRGFQAERIRQQDEQLRAARESMKGVLSSVSAADSLQAKMKALSSPGAIQLWTDPIAGPMMQDVAMQVKREYDIQSKARTVSLTAQQKEWNDALMFNGATPEAVEEGPGNPIYDSAASAAARNDAMSIAQAMSVDASSIPEKLPTLANGMLDKGSFMQMIRGNSPMDVSSSTINIGGNYVTWRTPIEQESRIPTSIQENREAERLIEEARVARENKDYITASIKEKRADDLVKGISVQLTLTEQKEMDERKKGVIRQAQTFGWSQERVKEELRKVNLDYGQRPESESSASQQAPENPNDPLGLYRVPIIK